MLRVTKNAQQVLDEELRNYEAFLMNRATVYAEQDDSIEIREKHIARSIKDYRNDYYYISRESGRYKERRKYQLLMLFFAVICLALYLLIILLFVKEGTVVNSVEVISLLGVLTTVVLVITIYFSMFRRHKVEKESENQRRIILFLNKWNEFESFLRVLYKKKNNKEPKSFRDLLLFYQQLPNVVNSGNPDMLRRLLNSRNNLIHRNIKDVNPTTIDGLINDMDVIIETLKSTE